MFLLDRCQSLEKNTRTSASLGQTLPGRVPDTGLSHLGQATLDWYFFSFFFAQLESQWRLKNKQTNKKMKQKTKHKENQC